jgi:hypothetical protein
MTLPPSPNPISADQIRTEFGPSGVSNSVSLGNYRISQTVSGLSNLPLDTGIPQSGAINFGSFRGKKLNIVVNYSPPFGTVGPRVDARSLYDANTSVTVIGGFKSKPNTVTNQKVWIHINGTVAVSSPAPSRTYCTFLTGSWDATTDLRIDIGPSGSIMGAGGAAGLPGSSAIGIIPTNSVVITNRGAVLPGGGGGGGGGQGGDGQVQTGRTGTTNVYSVGGPGGGGGLGQGYNQTNTAGAPGGASPSSGIVIGNVRITNAGRGGTGGTGGTWGNVGAGGSKGVNGYVSQPPNSRVAPYVTVGLPGLPGGSGGCDYVVSNDGTGVSGLSVNVALNTIPT